MESAPSSKREWDLTQAAFEGLLAQLDADREAAGVKYQSVIIKLTRFFERRDCTSPEDHADEVINIVARQLAEGKAIENLNAYFLAVAKRHVLTISRGPEIDPLEEPDSLAARPIEDEYEEIKERRLKYLDHCLEEIGSPHRMLILGYYEEDKQAKIDKRKTLAEGLGIDLNALRIRVCRIRMKLEKCLNECLKREAKTNARS